MQLLKKRFAKAAFDSSDINLKCRFEQYRHFLFLQMRFIILLFIGLSSASLFAQEVIPYRYENDFLTSGFYSNRREEVRKRLPEKSVAILFCAPERLYSNDVYYDFHQDPNFYYLTGFNSPNSVLIIFKEKFKTGDLSSDEILFIPPRDLERETWNGRRASMKDASEISGIENCFLSTDFYSFPLSDTLFQSVLYGPMPLGVIDDKKDTLDLSSLIEIFKQKFNCPPSNGDTYKLKRTITELREVKLKEELVLLRKAISISCDAHKQMMKSLSPGMTEYQVEAVGEYYFKRKGAENVGYPSICGGGENSCILHYQTNRRTLSDGDLILLDMGGEYHGYTADVTRTLPVNGRYSAEQKIIYNLVLEAHDSALKECKIGNTFQSPHKAAVRVIKKGLLNLGIIDKETAYSTYFMHGTSHYLGLDVHDVGTFTPLKEGNVITVEPGIYIPPNSPCDRKWWNIGIRIEDDILITANGFENLSDCCPVDPTEIEKLMAEPIIMDSGK